MIPIAEEFFIQLPLEPGLMIEHGFVVAVLVLANLTKLRSEAHARIVVTIAPVFIGRDSRHGNCATLGWGREVVASRRGAIVLIGG